MDGTVFHRENSSAPSYFLFMKKDSDWVSNHQWNKTDWPAADDTKHAIIIPDSLQKLIDSEQASQTAVSNTDSLQMTLNDVKIDTGDTPPYIKDGRTFY